MSSLKVKFKILQEEASLKFLVYLIKHYYSYMTAGSAKFLRIYYARVNEFLNELGSDE